MLLDDELSSEDALRLLERIEKDDELKDCWNRYNALALALKSEYYVKIEDAFLQTISGKIKQEPTILPPRRQVLGVLYSGWAAIAASILIVVVIIIGNLPEKLDSSKQMVAENEYPVPASKQKAAPAEAALPDPRFQDYLEAHNESSYATVTPSLLPYARVVTYSKGQ